MLGGRRIIADGWFLVFFLQAHFQIVRRGGFVHNRRHSAFKSGAVRSSVASPVLEMEVAVLYTSRHGFSFRTLR